MSNKLQGGVDELYRHYFQDTVQVAVGERVGTRRKPAPDMVEIALQELGVEKDEAVYVGDSDVDVATAAMRAFRVFLYYGVSATGISWNETGPSVLRTALLIYLVCWNPFPDCESSGSCKRKRYSWKYTLLFFCSSV